MQLEWPKLRELIMQAAFLAVTESMPSTIARELTDENPVIPLDVDVDGDVAMATLLTWSEQDSGWEPSLENADLLRRSGRWDSIACSGGMRPRDYPLTSRRPADPPGLHLRVYEAGPQRGPSGGKRWLTAALLVSAEVETLRVGDRERAVPFHGYMPVVVRNPAQATVAALSSDGSVLETIDLRHDSSGIFRELLHRDPDGWPFKIRQE
jgi:hypothetical protein